MAQALAASTSAVGAVLAVSASRAGYACALRKGHAGGLLVQHRADDLAATAAALLAQADLAPRALCELRLDVGPGSYTGLRVAVAFAAALQAFAALAVRTATSLELLALCAWRELGARAALVRPILDARRGRFNHAPVRIDGESLTLLAPPRAEGRDELGEAIAAGEVLLADAGALDVARALAAQRECTVLELGVALDPCALARALFDARLALRAPAPGTLEPLYLMGSYAEG